MDATWIPTMPVRRWIGAVLGVVLLLVGACTGELKSDRQLAQERANEYIAAQRGIDPEIEAAIRELDLVENMTPDQVTASWGKPAIVQKSLNETSEMWYFPCNYPHICNLSGSRRRRGGEKERYQSRAFFVNGRLVEWQD